MSTKPRGPSIVFNAATKRFAAGEPVLQGVTAHIEPGEFVCLLGPSGCGKSTLLRLVSGLTPLTSGAIQVDGMTPVDAREIVSFIFQDATLLPWRTVRANVGLGLELEGVARDRRYARVTELLSLVGLAAVAESYPRQLSGGMKMRASIARSLASAPRVLLLDEPFAALDELTRDRMNEELIRLHREHGWTVLFVTHSVAEAVFLGTRILVFAPHPGRIAHDLPIGLPAERNPELRLSDAFDRIATQVSRLVREAHRP